MTLTVHIQRVEHSRALTARVVQNGRRGANLLTRCTTRVDTARREAERVLRNLYGTEVSVEFDEREAEQK